MSILSDINAFAFDKTGTLTTGKASVTQIVVLDGDERGFLSLLAGLEAQSEHHSAAATRPTSRPALAALRKGGVKKSS